MKVYVVQDYDSVFGVFSSRDKAFEFDEARTKAFSHWWELLSNSKTHTEYSRNLFNGGRDAAIEVYKVWTYQEFELDEMGDK